MKKIKIATISLVSLLFFCLALSASAASLFFQNETKEAKAGDVFIVDVKLSSPAEKINVAEGAIFFDQNILEVGNLSTGDSAFSLWTRPPAFSNQAGKIVFAGGVPNGIMAQEATVMKIAFKAKRPGASLLVFSDDSALYLNDGRGTKMKPQLESLGISIAQESGEKSDAWQSLVASDKTPPQKLEVALGQDPSIFDNQFFISFQALDEESGIKSYEVKEGEGEFVPTESPYVLKDQSRRSIVLVRAIDQAGNVSLAKFDPSRYGRSGLNTWITWSSLALAIIIIIIIFFYRRIKRKNVKR